MLSKEQMAAVVERLYVLKETPKEEEKEKTSPSKELSPKEKEIVDRLTKVETNEVCI